jgi:hypothetical protein
LARSLPTYISCVVPQSVGWAELPGGAAAEATRPACLQSVNVSLARKKYGIQYPALYAGKEHIDPKGKCKDEKDVLAYNCVQRAHQNTVTMAGESVAPGCQSWPRRCAADARLRRAGRGVGGDHRHGPAAGRAQRPDLCDGYFVPACLPACPASPLSVAAAPHQRCHPPQTPSFPRAAWRSTRSGGWCTATATARVGPRAAWPAG